MADIKWLEGNRIQIAPPKRTKKITGTRFATILGLNPWSTAFEMWCAITKTYEKPLLCWEVISNARAFRDTQRSCHYGRGLILEDVSD